MRYLLPKVETYYKANLHTHSTVSDGAWTPEELKKQYKAQGYQILSYTDHEVLIPHLDLDDESFMTIPGYEFEVYEPGLSKHHRKSYHLNFFAKNREQKKQLFNRAYTWGNALKYVDQVVSDGNDDRSYSVEAVNRILAQANEMGFLVSYNHPNWSLHSYPDYAELKGLWAVEVFNNECSLIGYADDPNESVFQDLLRKGNRIFPLATDDFHSLPHPKHIFGGWIMVGAREFTYDSVMQALEKGDFYATTGPQIHSLTMEGTKLSVECSEAVQIKLLTHNRMGARLLAEPGSTLTAGAFDLTQWMEDCPEEFRQQAYFRLRITDREGKHAFTRAYWREDVL
ncbi:MAG: hypothetical protein E7437_04070 [Ruminococcaceae bacterium]|nr:hypothetical protein [Oscillospiraceae bacterium]